MQKGFIADLLTAANVLDSAGRPTSAEAILRAVAKSHLLELQIAAVRAAEVGKSDWAWLCVSTLKEILPKPTFAKFAEEIWRITSAAVDNCKDHLDAAMLRLYLSVIDLERQKNPAKLDGPDIAYILAMSLPYDSTGYSMRTQALVQALQSKGRRIACLTTPGFPQNRGVCDSSATDTVNGVVYCRTGRDLNRIPKTPADFKAAENAMLQVLSELKPRKVMAASNYATAIPALCASRRLGIPFIYEVRGFWELSQITRDAMYRNTKSYSVSYDIEGAVAAASDLIVTLTGSMRDELVLRGAPRDKIKLLPNAADLQALLPAPRNKSISAQLGLPDDVPVIGYIGSFTDYEGLDDLVWACSELEAQGHKFRLLLVGWDPRGENRIGPALKALALELGILDKIIMPGVVPQDQVSAWYSLIDIAPVPRRRVQVTELVSPLKPREAMAMGKAVIVSDLPPLVEMIAHGETGFIFPAGERGKLAALLAALLSDPSLRKKVGDAARVEVCKKHGWESRADEFWNVVDAVFREK